MTRGVLPTTDVLRNRYVDIRPQCMWCHNHAESVAHVLFQCCFAREMWESVDMQGLISTGIVETGVETIK